jgi:serine protease Do
MAQPIMKSLIEHGRVDRGFLGVTIQNLDSDLAKALGLETSDGVLVSDTTSGGPAEKAGLRRGDVVLSIDGRRVQSTGQLRNMIAASSPGSVAKIEILRGGERKTVSATLGRLPSDDRTASSTGNAAREPAAGLTLAPLDGALRQKFDVPPSVKGLVVTGVGTGSPAAGAGIEEGDVIVEAARAPLATRDDLARRWKEAKEGLAVLVWRKQRTFYAVLKRQ